MLARKGLRSICRACHGSLSAEGRSATSNFSPLQLLRRSSTGIIAEQVKQEPQNVTKIERIMALSDRFLAQPFSSHRVNRRVAPRGVYCPKAKKHPITPDEVLPPLAATRKMMDSFVSMDLRFSEDEDLLAQYIGGRDQIRMGRLMEDFDYMSGCASFRHVLPAGLGSEYLRRYDCFMVTAAVDRMDVLRPLTTASGEIPDLRLSGHVSYTSESSMEIFIRLSTLPSDPSELSETILLGRFTMACRSTKGGKFKIPQLEIESEEEKILWQIGKELRAAKKDRRNLSLKNRTPTDVEAEQMHKLFMGRQEIFKRNAAPPTDVVFMSDTKLSTAIMVHPAERNVNGQAFGGYLMRLAFETAFATACRFAKQSVKFLALDEIQFKEPVMIGNLLLLDSEVTFSPVGGDHKSFHVSVEAASMDLYSGETRVTNTFQYTFTCDEPLKHHVLPRSYRQAMVWLDSQRRREIGIGIRKNYIEG